MSHRSRKLTRARVAAALTTSVLAAPVVLGLLAPPASAATTAGHRASSGPLLRSTAPSAGFYCDLNDIAGLLSGVLGTLPILR